MVVNYIYGRRKELEVGEYLERSGFDWCRSAGSRGPADLLAQAGRCRLVLQVKSTRGGGISSARLNARERHRLLRAAARYAAIPVAVYTAGNQAWFAHAGDGRTLGDAGLRPLKYDYPDET